MKMLVVTQLDIEKMFNTVEEHHGRGYARLGCEVTFLYKELNQERGFRKFIKDSCLFHLAKRPDSEMESFRFNPLFNYYAGYRADAEARHTSAGSGVPFRMRLIRILSPLSSLRDLFFIPCAVLAALLTKKGPWQVCVGFGPWGGITARILKHLGMTQFVVYQDRDYEPGLVPYRLRARFTAAVERFCIKRADLVCSVGFLLAARRRDESGRNVYVIPNGVEWDKFSTSRDTSRLGHDLVYVGNVIDWAGLEHAILALPGIHETFPDARLLIIGDGLPSYVAGLKTLARAHGLDGHVVFIGQRRPEELPSLLAGTSIGLANSKPIPFRKYACPLKVMEYMAAGLPVIATRGTEAEEMLKQYNCGISVDHDCEQLKNAVLHILSNPEVLDSMRFNGIAASKELTWERLVTQEMDLVRDICSTRKTASD